LKLASIMKDADRDRALAPAAAIAVLSEPGAERVGPKAAERLADIATLFAHDLTFIEGELFAHATAGVAPATEAATHLLRSGGKRIRPLTVLLAAAAFGPVRSETRDLAVVAELVHLATLLHDDVLDDGLERRGQPTSRRLWGNAVSILAGDLLLTHSLERTSRLGRSAVLADLFRTLRRLVDGEVVQLRGRTRIDPTEETYFQIVENKTASLFGWSARAGARSVDAPEDAVAALGEFGERIGVAFQLVDDALDYEGGADKTPLLDLREGKLTLPLLRTLAERPELVREIERVRAGEEGEPCDKLVAAVKSSGACAETRRIAGGHTERALASLERTPAGPARDLLAAVAREHTQRAG
jgi:octaprenyl-diphosphate synthase